MNATQLSEIVSRFRTNETQLRRLKQSCPTRNAGATNRAMDRRYSDRTDMFSELLEEPDGKHLVGALNDERVLLERLADAKRHGMVRPELKVRLSFTRGRINAHIRNVRALHGA
jgi:hypothetical protein